MKPCRNEEGATIVLRQSGPALKNLGVKPTSWKFRKNGKLKLLDDDEGWMGICSCSLNKATTFELRENVTTS